MSTDFIDDLQTDDIIESDHVNQFGPPVNNLESGATYYGEAGNPTGTSTDDYSVTVNAGATPSYSVALTAGLMVHLKLPSLANTKPATLSVNAATAKPIKKIGQNLQAGDLPADAIVVLIYDEELDVFQLISNGNSNGNQVQPEDINEVASDRLLGRDTAGTGACEELTVNGGLEFTGSGGVQRSALTGDVTASAGSNATTIANAVVTYAKMQNVSATDKLLGRVTAGAGDIEEIACTAAGRALLDDADAAAQRTTLGLGTAATSSTGDFAAASHTHASADVTGMATDRLLGRDTTGTGSAEQLTVGGGLEFTGSGGVQRSALTGDVTASAGSNATTIANDAVSYAKIQNVSATDKLLGRATAGGGDVEEIACTAAGRALLDDADATAQRTTLGLGTAATSSTGDFAAASHTHASADVTGLATDRLLGRDTTGTGAAEQLTVGGGLEFTGSGGVQRSALTGDVTASAGSNATTIVSNAVTTAKIANDAVTYAKMQNVSATDKLLGRSTAGAGDVEEIACTAAGRALLDDADATAQRTTLGLGTAATSSTGDFAAASHTHASADVTGMATDRLLGRDTTGTGSAEQLTVGGGLEFTGSGGIQRSALTGEVTAGAGSGATTIASSAVTTAKIANDAVTYAKMQNVSATDKLLGRATVGGGDVEEISCTAAGRALLDDADAAAQRTTLGLGTAATSSTGDFAAASHAHAAGDITSGTLPVARGGTNLSSFAAGSLVYASAADVLAALGIGATGDILRVTGGLPAWSNTIPLLYLGSAPSVVTPSCLGALGNHATNPVVALRQDNAGTSAQLLDLYHDNAAGAAGNRFLRCYRDSGATPLLVAAIDTRGAFVSYPQGAGSLSFAAQALCAAAIGNIHHILSAYLLDDASNTQNWANLAVEQRVITDGAECGKLYVQLMADGALRSVWVVDEDTNTHTWLLNNATRMLLNASFLRTSGGFRSGGNADPIVTHASAPLFAGIQPHGEMLTGTSTGTYEELVVVRHSGQDGTAVLRRLGLLLKLDGEANTTQSARSGGLVLESSAANAGNPSLFLVQGNASRVEIDSNGNVDILGGAGKLKIGGTAVTSTAAELNILDGVTSTTAELNLLDLASLTAGHVLKATGASSAAWGRLNGGDTKFQGCILRLTSNVDVSNGAVEPITWTHTGGTPNATEELDTDGFHSDISNFSRFTIPSGMGGVYTVWFCIRFDWDVDGDRLVRLAYNGVDTQYEAGCRAGYSNNTVLTGYYEMELGSNDYLQLQVYQNSGATDQVLAGSRWGIRYVGKLS